MKYKIKIVREDVFDTKEAFESSIQDLIDWNMLPEDFEAADGMMHDFEFDGANLSIFIDITKE